MLRTMFSVAILSIVFSTSLVANGMVTTLSDNELSLISAGTACTDCDYYAGSPCTGGAFPHYPCAPAALDDRSCYAVGSGCGEVIVEGPSKHDQTKSGTGNKHLEDGWCIKTADAYCQNVFYWFLGTVCTCVPQPLGDEHWYGTREVCVSD